MSQNQNGVKNISFKLCRGFLTKDRVRDFEKSRKTPFMANLLLIFAESASGELHGGARETLYGNGKAFWSAEGDSSFFAAPDALFRVRRINFKKK
ncbi:MAG: hypothetical protein NZ602_07090 [Thermoguttaceae bacterium]|nr:hypothetical protein [Thermoguttaceae bacterium]MDW8037897.1 hypothetical protein [Thermoguttaceae bacterium]